MGAVPIEHRTDVAIFIAANHEPQQTVWAAMFLKVSMLSNRTELSETPSDGQKSKARLPEGAGRQSRRRRDFAPTQS